MKELLSSQLHGHRDRSVRLVKNQNFSEGVEVLMYVGQS